MFQNKRMNGFHGSTCLVWRSAVRVASQMYRDLHHEETRKREPLRGLNPALPVWPLHGGFGWHFTVIRIQLMVFSSHGNSSSWKARNRVPPLDRHTHSHPQFREPKRLSSFENYLRIQPQKTIWATCKDGFHGSTCLLWRSAVRATSQIYRDSNQEETRKSELLGGPSPAVPVWPLHGGFA